MLQSSNPFQIVSNNFYSDETYGEIIKENSMVILNEKLPDYYQYMVKVLEESLDIKLNNLGLANIKNGQIFHCLGYFGLKVNDDGESVMGLELGYNGDNYTSIFLPCNVEKNERIVGNSKKITSYEYTINGWKLELIKPSVESDKQYIQLSVLDTPDKYTDENGVEQVEDLDEIDARFDYVFPFLLDKNFKEDVKKFWSVGKFKECLRQFGKFKTYSQANKLFTHLFESGQFPKEGVAILCNNGTKRVALAGSHPKITKDIYSSNWEVISVSHPELLVRVGLEIVSLNDITDIQFTNANNGNEGYKFLENYDGVYSDYVIIHFIGKNSKNPAHMPVNIVAVNPNHILKVLEKFPTLQESVSKYITLPSTNVVTTVPKSIKPTVSTEWDDVDDLDDIIF